MADFSFIHAADLHIDSPLLGLDRYEGAPTDEIRGASRVAFKNLVDLALAERVAFVVLAGDVFDGEWRDYNTGVFLNRELGRLAQAGMRVFLVQGNHDAESVMTRSLRLPPNAHVFSHAAPETVELAEHGVALHGQSFGEQRVTTNLAAAYPEALPGRFNLGVLHTAIEGRQGHARYAPCNLADLTNKRYDYWALGHVHRREVVAESPWVVFPGNIQGRHIRETGPKGCSLVTVAGGAVASVRHVPLDVVRWASVTEDVSALDRPEDVVDRLAEVVEREASRADGRLLAVRLRAVGVTSSGAMLAEPHRWRAELISRVTTLVGHKAWVEKVLFDAAPPRENAGADARENLAVLERILADLAASPVASVPDFVGKLSAKLGADAPQGDDSPFSPEAMARAKAEAIELLRFRLRLRRARGAGA